MVPILCRTFLSLACVDEEGHVRTNTPSVSTPPLNLPSSTRLHLAPPSSLWLMSRLKCQFLKHSVAWRQHLLPIVMPPSADGVGAVLPIWMGPHNRCFHTSYYYSSVYAWLISAAAFLILEKVGSSSAAATSELEEPVQVFLPLMMAPNNHRHLLLHAVLSLAIIIYSNSSVHQSLNNSQCVSDT